MPDDQELIKLRQDIKAGTCPDCGGKLDYAKPSRILFPFRNRQQPARERTCFDCYETFFMSGEDD